MIVPIVIGALGSIPLSLTKYLSTIGLQEWLNKFSSNLECGFAWVEGTSTVNLVQIWIRHYRATDAWKSKVYCSCQYIHSVCTRPLFLGHMTHYCVSWFYNRYKKSSVPTCIDWKLVNLGRLSDCIGIVLHNTYTTGKRTLSDLCLCTFRLHKICQGLCWL